MIEQGPRTGLTMAEILGLDALRAGGWEEPARGRLLRLRREVRAGQPHGLGTMPDRERLPEGAAHE